MKQLPREAVIGTILILILVLAAFMWVLFFKSPTQSKYHPPYKYYSGDKPDYKPRK